MDRWLSSPLLYGRRRYAQANGQPLTENLFDGSLCRLCLGLVLNEPSGKGSMCLGVRLCQSG